MANVITNTHTSCKRKQARQTLSLNAKRLGSCTIRKVLIAPAKTSTTKYRYAKAVRQQQVT